MADTLPETSSLGLLLEARLVEWENARKPQELKLLECYQDVMRIARDDDTSGTGAARSRKAKGLFIGSTRNKVRAARAKITDALFGNGQMPFDTNPTNEKLAPYADVMEDIITWQMEEGGLKPLLKTGVNTLATYGTGFIFGPFVRKETITETMVQEGAIVEQKYEFDLPYFELGNTLDVYPDPEAREVESGRGVFWATMESPATIKEWKNDPSYRNIDMALTAPGDRGNETGSERAAQMRGNVQYWFKNDRVKVARFFGKVPAEAMDAWEKANNAEESEDPMGAAMLESADHERREGDTVDAIIIMAGGVVVKAVENPYDGKNPAHRCLYEAVEHEMWGVGVAENNAPHQKVTNAAFRLFMEGKGMALLGTAAVDRAAFLPTEDFRKYPGKVYQFKPGLSPDQKKEAIQFNVEPDITGGWLDVIRMSEQFSDDDTGITKYTQGDDSRNLNKTASGISMIMSASSLPMKEVIQNIDAMWIEPIVECYIDWNLKYLSPETVQKIHGVEAAQLWAQIKDFGKSSFMDWQATGTASFMQKEVLTNKIRAFSEFALGNQVTAPLIDAKELLRQTWDVMEIGKESPILEDKDGEEGLSPAVKQRMQMVSDHVDQLQQELQKAQQAAQQADKKAVDETFKRMKAEIDADKAAALLAIEKAKDSTQAATGVDPAAITDMVNQAVASALAHMMSQGQPASAQPEAQAPPEMPPEASETPAAEAQEPPPGQAAEQPEQPPQGGFFTPEQPQ